MGDRACTASQLNWLIFHQMKMSIKIGSAAIKGRFVMNKTVRVLGADSHLLHIRFAAIKMRCSFRSELIDL